MKFYKVLFSDVNLEIFITHKNEDTKVVSKEKMVVKLNAAKRSPLNDSFLYGLSIKFNDIIGIDIYLTIVSSTPFSVFLALEKSDSCSNYETMSRLDCNEDCTYQECVFQVAEPDGYYRNVVYCRYKCQETSIVLIRRRVQPGMQYLPPNILIRELAALAI